jgi:hypothetical protein
MLTELDEMPWHQLPTTFDHVGTSDPRFFDRHWFAIYDPEAERSLQFTMAVYNNMNVLDAGFVYIENEVQYNVRASRSLRPHFETRCGPLGVAVLEPLRILRLEIEPGRHAVHGELLWTATHAPEEEAASLSRTRGRVVTHQQRYDQVGRCTGWLEVEGRHVDVDRWWTARDHSWGVRPGMGVEEPVTAMEDQLAREAVRAIADPGQAHAWGQSAPNQPFLFFLLFFTTQRYAGHILCEYKGERRTRIDGHVHDDKHPESGLIAVSDVRLRVAVAPQTRRFRRVEVDVDLGNGDKVRMCLDAHGPAIVMAGLGYSGGFDDGRGLGVWRGEGVVESEAWGVADPEVVQLADATISRPLHRLQPVRISGLDAGAGTGSTTLVFNGELPPDIDRLS